MKATPEQMTQFKNDLELLKSAHEFEIVEIKEDEHIGPIAMIKVYNIVVKSGNHGWTIGYAFTQYGAETIREMCDGFLGNKMVEKAFSVDIDTKAPLVLSDGMVRQMISNLGRR